MPDILSEIKFDSEQLELLQNKLDDKKFCHNQWGDDDLQKFRSFVRNFYRVEQKAICCYCKHPVSLQSASNCHIEHIAPKSKYRQFIFEPKNLCVICADCNDIKRDQETINQVIDPLKNGVKRVKYPRTSNAFKIVHPHFDDYKEHIIVLNNMFYVDKSPKGNFTIYSCRLNRRLYEYGWEKEIVDDQDLTILMTQYINEKSGSKRRELLNRFKELLVQT